jgi:hypothetical protein
MRTLTLLTIAVLSTTAVAQTNIPVGPFRAVELTHGGHVIVRHGPVQRVTLLTGDTRYTQVRLDGQRLVIDKCAAKCPRGYRMQVEVITPQLSAAAVSNGGTLQIAGAFPAQAAIEAEVEQGGMVDIRAIAADAVDASVHSGGRIFTTPRETLTATIQSGGAITYWGSARVRSSVRDGGVVMRGTPEDAGKPLSEWAPPVPPIPPVAPIPPQPNG